MGDYSMEDIIKVLLNNILLVIITIIADKTLTPVFEPIFQKIFSYKSKIIDRISHFIYSRIAEGVYINIAFYIFIFVCCEFTTTFVDNSWLEEVPFVNANIIQIAVVTMIYFFMFLFLMLTNFINKSITKMMCNIEILSAYISNDIYKRLKSSFFSIDSKKDYDKLWSFMETLASGKNVRLK